MSHVFDYLRTSQDEYPDFCIITCSESNIELNYSADTSDLKPLVCKLYEAFRLMIIVFHVCL